MADGRGPDFEIDKEPELNYAVAAVMAQFPANVAMPRSVARSRADAAG